MRTRIDLSSLVTDNNWRLRLIGQIVLLLNDLVLARVQLILWKAFVGELRGEVCAEDLRGLLHLYLRRGCHFVRISPFVAR